MRRFLLLLVLGGAVLTSGGLAMAANGLEAGRPRFSWVSSEAAGGGYRVRSGLPISGMAAGGGYVVEGGIGGVSPDEKGFARPVAFFPLLSLGH
ncbi:MAG: hypothetical protein K6U89_13765 [Chloroflexi bacterium]|jgi:hypothetical protein|nr:hypothetical protein [Chloroflexota bacterium]